MSSKISLDELVSFEQWAKSNLNPQIEVALRAINCLRDLMSQELSNKQLLRYLRQQMGISPKSESDRVQALNQLRESGMPDAVLRQS